MASKKGGLGKGIDALFKEEESVVPSEFTEGSETKEVDVTLIDRNPAQPRKTFNEEGLQELARSIATYGIIQPIVLKPLENGRYMIVAGERRYRASLIAKLKKVPAVICDFTQEQIQEISLIENLHREDLNAIEAAEGMRELMDTYNLTQEEVAQRIKKSRPYVTNTLRLLQLPEEVMQMVRDGVLSPGHARTLISIDDKEYLIALAKKAVEKKMSVRDLEQNVRLYFTRKTIPTGPNKGPRLSLEMKEFVSDMKRVFATKVKIKGNTSKGRITIDYFTEDDLERIHTLIEYLKQREEEEQ